MSPTAPQPSERPLRADAQRNRERIVAAARELFAAQGLDVPLDAIARRAGVGIATLYRRFPDREAVACAVALDAFQGVDRLARHALDDGGGGLRGFLAAVADRRIGVLMAGLMPVLTELAPSAELTAAFQALLTSVSDLIAHAQRTGELRPDVSADDVMLLVALLTRPLEGIPLGYAAAVTPRLLHLLLEGISPRPHATPPPPAPPAPEGYVGFRPPAQRRRQPAAGNTRVHDAS
jgi:AcrR family transcriptional regulator